MKRQAAIIFIACIFQMGCWVTAAELQKLDPNSESTTKVDLLFVIDNSGSMKDEAVALAQVSNLFTEILSNDAVDLQMAITTTSVDYSAGATPETDPGEAGIIIGSPTPDPDEISKQILCNATYWDPTLLTEDSEITAADLDEMCGPGWSGNSGSGNEEPLEAALLALCRSVETPPDACYDARSVFDDSQKLSNEGLIRDNSIVVIVMMGDEGDNSRRIQQGESDPVEYREAFESFALHLRFVGIGPNYIVNASATEGSFPCNSGGASTWQVERLRYMTESTDGLYFPLEEISGEACVLSDFSNIALEIIEWLQQLE